MMSSLIPKISVCWSLLLVMGAISFLSCSERLIYEVASPNENLSAGIVQEDNTIKLLNFLKSKMKYNITYYEDAQNSHYLHNKESYRIRKEKIERFSNKSKTCSRGRTLYVD